MDDMRSAEEREQLIARLELENAQLIDRLARLRPALHGLTEDLVRAHRETAEWRRRYQELAADVRADHGDGDRMHARPGRPRHRFAA